MHQPWRHRTGLDTDAGILSAMPPHRTLDLFRIGGALAAPQSATGVVHDTDRRQFLGDVQTDIVGHRIASDGESHRATARSAALSASQPAAAITRCPHMERHVAAVADDLRADLDQLMPAVSVGLLSAVF